jgi:hypothetical protein
VCLYEALVCHQCHNISADLVVAGPGVVQWCVHYQQINVCQGRTQLYDVMFLFPLRRFIVTVGLLAPAAG